MDANQNQEPFDEEDSDLGPVLMAIAVIFLVIDCTRASIMRGFTGLPPVIQENLGLATAIAVSCIMVLPEWKYWIMAPFLVPFAFSTFGWGFLSMIEGADPEGSGDFFESDAAFMRDRVLVLGIPTFGLAVLAAIR